MKNPGFWLFIFKKQGGSIKCSAYLPFVETFIPMSPSFAKADRLFPPLPFVFLSIFSYSYHVNRN